MISIPGCKQKKSRPTVGIKHLKLIKPYQTKNLHLYYLTLIEPLHMNGQI